MTSIAETRRLDEILPEDDDSDQSCCSTCSSAAPQQQIKIATWPQAAETLTHYANLYNAENTGSKVQVETLPSLQDLQDSIEIAKTSLAIDSIPKVDGYVVPPLLLGTLSDELAFLEDIDTSNYLKVYQHLTTVDGKTAAIPLFGGNPLFLFYHKNMLDAELTQLAPPNTWKELAEFAEQLSNSGKTGLCLGRLSESACRKQASLSGEPCHSESMSHVSMILASLSQSKGSSSGWLFHMEPTGKIKPLLNQTLGPTLEIMEKHVPYGGSDAFETDVLDNLQSFQDGSCAMTILSNPPLELLQDPNVGVAPLPGSPLVLNYPLNTQLGKCTFRNCTHGKINPNEPGQGVNRAPMVPLDIAMGTILEASNHQDELMAFFQFVETQRSLNTTDLQTITQDELQKLDNSDDTQLQSYANLIDESANDPNVVWPVTVPGSLSLLSELDQQVYDYLMGGNYTAEAREEMVTNVDKAWKVRMQQQDSRVHATPLSILYQRSLQGVVTEQKIDLYIGTGFRVVGWAMGTVACLMALGFAVWVFVYRENRVVQASQPLFLWLVCAGSFIMASCIFPFGIEDDIVSYRGASIACMSSMWQYGLGFVMMVSALYSKIWRINRIFRYQHKIRKIQIEKKHIMVPFGFLFSINFALLLIWTIVDHYEWIREEANPGFTNGFCDSNHYWAFLAMLVFANLLVAVYTLIQAFECRNLSTEYDESVWIGFALACVVQTWLIGLPILQLTGNTPNWLFITKTGIVFFTVISTLLCVFVPKIQFVQEAARQAEEEDGVTKSARAFGSGRSIIGAVAKPFQSTFGNIRMGSQYMVSRSSENPLPKSNRSSGVIGIRIVRNTGEYAQDMEKVQTNFKAADSRRRMLQDQLESLQERFEQYIISNHPHGAHHAEALDHSERSDTNK